MIKCLECGKEFKSAITNTHLKRCCGRTVGQYKSEHGENSLCTEELREKYKRKAKEVGSRESVKESRRKNATEIGNRESVKESRSLKMTEHWADPIWGKEMRQKRKSEECRKNVGNGSRASWEVPELRKNRIEGQKRGQNRPEVSNHKKEVMLSKYHGEEGVKKRIEAYNKALEYWNTLEVSGLNERNLQYNSSSWHLLVKGAMLSTGVYSGFKSEQWVGCPRIGEKRIGFRCDEVNWDLKIVIEVQSCHYHCCRECDPERKDLKYEYVKERVEKDLLLKEYLKQKGYTLIEIWGHELNDMPKVIEKIKSVIEQVKAKREVLLVV